MEHRIQGALLKPNRQRKEATSDGWVETADGARVYYCIEGDGGIPMVFCYGIMCSTLHWTYQIEELRQNHTAIWFDYRGHQNSSFSPEGSALTLDLMVEDLCLVLKEVERKTGIDQAIFLGHSMGVNTVLEFYRRFPEKVRAMVLCSGTPKNPLESIFDHNVSEPLFQSLSFFQQKIPFVAKQFWRWNGFNPLVHWAIAKGGFNLSRTADADIRRYIRDFSKMDPSVFTELMKDLSEVDSTPWLHQIDVPALVIAGERDYVTPLKQQKLMAQLIPRSEFFEVRKGSHCCQMDFFELVTRRIEIFIDFVFSEKISH